MVGYSLKELAVYFLKLGSLGWGGPVALVGFMHRDLVETKRWIDEHEYKEGLALAQLAPGPLAAQLAIYLGYVHHRVWGATVAGISFVMPSFVIVTILGMAYVAYGGLAWMQSVFYGVSASVIGIIAVSSQRLLVKHVGRDPWLISVSVIAAVSTYLAEKEYISVILISGVLVWLVKAPPRWIRSVPVLSPFLTEVSTVSGDPLLLKIVVFFGTAGTFVFGSGLAIVPFLYGGVVKEFGWLTEQQFIDAVAVAMITPGPVVITVGFIGYLVAGLPGACAAALATFLPCYVFTILPAPYFKKFGRQPGVKAFVDGVTAAAIGTIAGAVLVLCQRTLTDMPAWFLACGTVAVVYKQDRVKEPYVIAAAALLGVVLRVLE
jgi:chromate transporter